MAAVGSSKKGCGQPDHTTKKYVTKSRKGIPIRAWVTTEVKNGLFTRTWE